MVCLRCLGYAVYDRGAGCTVNGVDYLPVFLPYTEFMDGSFAGIIVNGDVSVCKEHSQGLFLSDTVIDSFQCLPFGKTTRGLNLFCPRKESLHQRLDCDLPLFLPIIRFQIR